MERIDPEELGHTAERFVLGQLEGKELDDFLSRLTLDPSARNEVEAARERIKAVRALHTRASAPSNGKWVLIALLLLASAAGIYMLMREEKPSFIPPQAPVEQVPTPPQQEQQKQPEEKKQSSSAPIAASYTPNRTLEYQLGSGQYREGTAAEFRWVNAPKVTPVWPKKGAMIPFALDLSVEAEPETIARLQWQVFSNNQADYEAGKSLYKGSFNSKELGSRHSSISVAQDLKLVPGLYYFLIENTGNGDVYFVGKFRVDQ